MGYEADNAFSQEAKHKNINGRQARIEYHEIHSPDGGSIVRYSAMLDGKPYPLGLEISKAILQNIEEKYDNQIYHIISDSILDQIKKETSTLSTRFREARIPGKPMEYHHHRNKTVPLWA